MILDGADDVVMESTYGGREHEPAEEAIRLLAEVVREVASHKGVLLIPAFAIGRTQETVLAPGPPARRGRLAHLPLYLGFTHGLARPATSTVATPAYYDDETFRLLQAGETPLDYPGRRSPRPRPSGRGPSPRRPAR